MIERLNPDLAPETDNSEQEDEEAQAQTVADEARGRAVEDGLSDSDKVNSGEDSDDVQDLVDHMNQMDRSGTIDMDAYRGEENYDDNEDELGEAAKPDDLRSDGT